MNGQTGFSRRSFQDNYYDGQIGHGFGEGYDEDSQEVVRIADYWNFKISEDEQGYIEDASDDWYLDMMSGKLERVN